MWASEMNKRAWILAYKYHKDQKYGEQAYTHHLRSVSAMAELLYGSTHDTNTYSVAVLHDSLEDTDITEIEILEATNPTVLASVIAITKQKGQSLEEYIAEVKTNEIATKVKVADAMSNLQHSLLYGHKRRIKKYLKTLSLLTGE